MGSSDPAAGFGSHLNRLLDDAPAGFFISSFNQPNPRSQHEPHRFHLHQAT